MEIQIVRNILEKNDRSASLVRQFCHAHRIILINVMGSPGAGKTTSIRSLLTNSPYPASVIEGDIASTIDAERIAKDGFPVVQINTGGACHLIADSILQGLHDLKPQVQSIVFVENIGNLVCPASFDLGENLRVLVSSVAEGDDKPYKYPVMFERANMIVLSKNDVSDVIGFDTNYYLAGIHKVQPQAQVFPVSFNTQQGVDIMQKHFYATVGELLRCKD